MLFRLNCSSGQSLSLVHNSKLDLLADLIDNEPK